MIFSSRAKLFKAMIVGEERRPAIFVRVLIRLRAFRPKWKRRSREPRRKVRMLFGELHRQHPGEF